MSKPLTKHTIDSRSERDFLFDPIEITIHDYILGEPDNTSSMVWQGYDARPLPFSDSRKKAVSYHLRSEVQVKIEVSEGLHGAIKEKYYIKGVGNLLKRANYLNLCIQLEQGLIEEDEFDKEIDDNPDQYVVDMSSVSNELDLFAIDEAANSITSELNIELTKDDIEDIFGVNF